MNDIRKTSSKLLLASLLLIAARSRVCAQQPRIENLTVEQTVDEAIRRNLDFFAQRYDLSIAEAQIITAKLRPNPILTLDADHLDLLGTGFTTQSVNGSTPNNGGPTEYSVRGDFIHERGGKRQARTALATGNRDVVRLQLADAVRSLILNTQQACVDVLKAKQARALAEENLKTFQNVVEINRLRFKDGDIAQVELMRSEVAELQYANAVRQANLQETSALSRLELLLGRTPLRPVDVEGDLREDFPDPTRDALISSALRDRPDLRALERDEERAEADVRLQKANAKVDWQIGSEYRRQTDSAEANTLGFFLQSQVPIFNRNQGEIARAEQALLQAQARTRALRAAVQNDVDLAFLQFQVSSDTVRAIEQSMLDKAKSVRSISEYAYKRGDASLVDFIDAVRAYNDTVQSYNDARADYARSLYGLDAASGSSTAAGKVPLP